MLVIFSFLFLCFYIIKLNQCILLPKWFMKLVIKIFIILLICTSMPKWFIHQLRFRPKGSKESFNFEIESKRDNIFNSLWEGEIADVNESL